MDSEQIVYRAGHDVEAARARGKVHGLEFARQCWDELEAEGVSEVLTGPLVLAPWAEQIREWSHAELVRLILSRPQRLTLPREAFFRGT